MIGDVLLITGLLALWGVLAAAGVYLCNHRNRQEDP